MESFLRTFLRHPATVGAIAPSSQSLAREMMARIDFATAGAIVEVGAGTGVFTQAILERLSTRSPFLAIEKLPELARALIARFGPAHVVEGDALDLPAILKARAIGPVDAVISGLPWAAFPAALQTKLIDAISACLIPAGRFSTFAYVQGLVLPSAWRFRNLLDRRFLTVATSRVVWRNLPPAFVYHCQGPRRAA